MAVLYCIVCIVYFCSISKLVSTNRSAHILGKKRKILLVHKNIKFARNRKLKQNVCHDQLELPALRPNLKLPNREKRPLSDPSDPMLPMYEPATDALDV